MIVEIGHSHPTDGDVVTYVGISDAKDENGEYLASYIVGSDPQEVRDHLYDNPGLVTHLPGNTAILEVVATTRGRYDKKPTWVHIVPEGRDPEEAEDFQRFCAGYFRCESGRPHDIEETHWTLHGGTNYGPGVTPEENSSE